MRRGRPKLAKRQNAPHGEFRKSTAPIVVICRSHWTPNTDCFCSKSSQWKVVIHNPDTKKWWDRLVNKSRIRSGPPNDDADVRDVRGCHVVAVYDNEEDGDDIRMMDDAVKALGEITDIFTIAFLVRNQQVVRQIREEVETAISSSCVLTIDRDGIRTSYTELRSLWAFHDAYHVDTADKSLTKLSLYQVADVCQQWSSLKWRWNRHQLCDLYRHLRNETVQPSYIHDIRDGTKETEQNTDSPSHSALHKFRRSFEKKALVLLRDHDTEHVADFVLSRGAMRDEHKFGRIHSLVRSPELRIRTTHENAKYIVVSKKLHTPILNAYDYATCSNCTKMMENLQILSGTEYPKTEFYIPITGSAMMTFSLIPALFPTSINYRASQAANQFDSVLGSSRMWEEHMTLKVSIIYLFQGKPGPLWDIATTVVREALPNAWNALLNEAPDEVFLRALLHPDVMEHGRLLHQSKYIDDKHSRLVPSTFDAMSRIFALGRFVRTLDDPNTIVNSIASKIAVASTMKLNEEQVEVIVHECKWKPLSTSTCQKISQIQSKNIGGKNERSDDQQMTAETMEILAMLGLFLKRDRKSFRDASRFDPTDLDEQSNETSKALADCAMYCGNIRWLSKEDEDEEGIWTCVSCLHRWQKRRPREAYQTRKLMHPMTLVPFKREEYYDVQDWDNIMEGTEGDIAKLGVNFYWGNCSSEGCSRVCPAVSRSGVCAETDGIPLDDFAEVVVLHDGLETTHLRSIQSSLKDQGPLGPNSIVTADHLEKYFESEEKLLYLPGPLRRRVRNCIDKSTYILPRGLYCSSCTEVPDDAIDEYCPYCGMGFEPVFACVHYHCPRCEKHFCKACLGIDGIHFRGIYSQNSHVCWKVLGNRYSYHNKGLCGNCRKERPWPKTHALVSAGPQISKRAMIGGGNEMTLQEAIKMQSSNLEVFTKRYNEGAKIFMNCTHTYGLGSKFCHCGSNYTYEDID